MSELRRAREPINYLGREIGRVAMISADKEHEKARKKIAQDTEEFLARGGVIKDAGIKTRTARPRFNNSTLYE